MKYTQEELIKKFMEEIQKNKHFKIEISHNKDNWVEWSMVNKEGMRFGFKIETILNFVGVGNSTFGKYSESLLPTMAIEEYDDIAPIIEKFEDWYENGQTIKIIL